MKGLNQVLIASYIRSLFANTVAQAKLNQLIDADVYCTVRLGRSDKVFTTSVQR